jgi:hypothetical protein
MFLSSLAQQQVRALSEVCRHVLVSRYHRHAATVLVSKIDIPASAWPLASRIQKLSIVSSTVQGGGRKRRGGARSPATDWPCGV